MNRANNFAWRPTTTVILIGGFAIVLVAMVVAFFVTNFQPTTMVKINTSVYRLQLADNDIERTQGLSGVKELPVNGGLLMVFDEDSECGIWMKDMLIPLDIVWLNSAKEVIFIKKNVSPDLGTSTVFKPKELCRYVLELPVKSVQTSNIKLGQKAEFKVEGE